MPVSVRLSPSTVSIVKTMEPPDPLGQGEDGGLPHGPRLGPHTHRELDLEGVNPVDLGVFLHYKSTVVVAQLPWPGPAGGGNTADGLQFLLGLEILHDAGGETLLSNDGLPDGLVARPELPLQ